MRFHTCNLLISKYHLITCGYAKGRPVVGGFSFIYPLKLKWVSLVPSLQKKESLSRNSFFIYLPYSYMVSDGRSIQSFQ